MVCQLGDIKQITDQPGHHLAGVVPVIVGIGQGHILVNKILPHIRLHTGAHAVAGGGHRELAQGPQQIPQQQRRQQPPQGLHNGLGTAGKQPLRQPPEDLRKAQVNDAKHHRTEAVQIK